MSEKAGQCGMWVELRGRDMTGQVRVGASPPPVESTMNLAGTHSHFWTLSSGLLVFSVNQVFDTSSFLAKATRHCTEQTEPPSTMQGARRKGTRGSYGLSGAGLNLQTRSVEQIHIVPGSLSHTAT